MFFTCLFFNNENVFKNTLNLKKLMVFSYDKDKK